MKIVVVFDSKTGSTEKMAHAIAKGAQNSGAEVTVKRAEKVVNKDLQEADGIIMGSPTYYGQMSGKLKQAIDDSVELHTKLTGKVGAAFTSSGGAASGAETTLLSILQAMLVHGMIIQGNAAGSHYGAAVKGAPQPEDLKVCEELGAKVATLINQLKR
ncbi:MAG: flavodoxin family protein [Candidatus Bathyarchaeota archaeon]|nr:flavodoxin family protein [Candidatus Bathyarchaeota archaeon]